MAAVRSIVRAESSSSRIHALLGSFALKENGQFIKYAGLSSVPALVLSRGVVATVSSAPDVTSDRPGMVVSDDATSRTSVSVDAAVMSVSLLNWMDASP